MDADPPRRRTTDNAWNQPRPNPATPNRRRTRAWILLAAIAATVIGAYLWGNARSHTPANRLQSADAREGHAHDLADYTHRLNDLKPKCAGTADDLERWVDNSVAVLRNSGVTSIDRLGMLVYLDQNTDLTRTVPCDQALALYAAERGGRP